MSSANCLRRQRFRSATATARLASDWPMMKRSSSETISRGVSSVMGRSPGSAARLPGPDGLGRVDEHEDVEREVVADRPSGEELEREGDGDGRLPRQAGSEEEARG